VQLRSDALSSQHAPVGLSSGWWNDKRNDITARHRAGSKLAATELRDGSLPEVRQLAQQLLAEHQA
jgi:hypothetical protein